jgi:hypothetical protein
LFASDVFIEDRVAAGLVAADDVLVATAVDLMMARDCQGKLGEVVFNFHSVLCVTYPLFSAAFVGTFSSHFSRLASASPHCISLPFKLSTLIARAGMRS